MEILSQSFASQLMQSPPYQYNPSFQGMQQQGTPLVNQVPNQPPPWALSIIEDIKTLKIRVQKISSMKKL